MATVNIFDMADTWNDSGTTFTAIKMNVTDTASQQLSRLLDLQVGSITKFSVQKNGNVRGRSFGSPADSAATIEFTGDDNRIYLDASVSLTWGATIFDADTQLWRDGATDTLALRRDTNPNVYRIYRTFTNTTNYERQAFQSGAGFFEWAAETAGSGTDNIDLKLTPAGTGVVQFGTRTALGTEITTGYITIKDSGGTTRLLAVVSA